MDGILFVNDLEVVDHVAVRIEGHGPDPATPRFDVVQFQRGDEPLQLPEEQLLGKGPPLFVQAELPVPGKQLPSA